MTRTVCDICGADVNDPTYGWSKEGAREMLKIESKDHIVSEQYDLCPKCSKKIRGFVSQMKGGIGWN